MASASLGCELDLSKLVQSMPGSEYNPESFPGLVFRLKQPKTATLLFRSGKLVCTGAKTLKHVQIAVDKVTESVRAAGVKVEKSPTVEVQNIVASSNLESPINLASVVITLGLERVEYEPEVFPGLVYRMDDPKVVILLFGSGRLVCTGARRPEDVGVAVEKLAEELRQAELLAP